MPNDDELKKARLKAMKLLERRDYTEAALRRKLSENDFSDEAIDAAVEYVRSYGYIDDLRYAQNYVRCNSSLRSRRDIAGRLRERGVSPELISMALESDGPDEDEEDHLLRRLISKKCKDPSVLDREGRQKLYAYMYNKGFDTHRVEKILDKITEETALDITYEKV